MGQEASVVVLKQYVKEGKGRHQSYVFCGLYGSGKTTLARILARALLCEGPVNGASCDVCQSCLTLLSGGAHECFLEMDAATRSGKDDMLKITEDIQYSTFNGKRRIYLFDEAHRLSKQALDALLKVMEDSVPGSEEKQLVCIFCTTEPEKMQPTIFSRCAPAFVIRTVPPEVIADRLARICTIEGVAFEQEALVTIAETVECHIRDALKIVEGVSVVGAITVDSVLQYLRLGSNDLALDLLMALGNDLNTAIASATALADAVSPSSAYERIADAALCAYRYSLGIGKIPTRWKKPRIEALAARGPQLASIASRFASPPRKPSPHTLILDSAAVHYSIISGISPSANVQIVLQQPAPSTQIQVEPIALGIVSSDAPKNVTPAIKTNNIPQGVVVVDPRAVGTGSRRGSLNEGTDRSSLESSDVLTPDMFRHLVRHHLRELNHGRVGPPR